MNLELFPSQTRASHHSPSVDRRNFLKAAGLSIAAAGVGQFTTGCARAQTPPAPTGPYKLPPLGYAFDALEPYIDARTMEIHHDKHHAAYVNNLNAAVAGTDLGEMPVDELIANLPIWIRCRRTSAPPCRTTAAATPTTRSSGSS
jgi:Fe-Mn family superoxide dismutase